MPDRITFSPGRIVISKPGHSSSNPSLADANKIFDSNWTFAGCIIMCRVVKFTLDGSGGVRDVMYPKALDYFPHGLVMPCQNSNPATDGYIALTRPRQTEVSGGGYFPTEILGDRVRFHFPSGSTGEQSFLVVVMGAN